jgi:bifunctional pyridoxal-dependent enzyme with beta-cystathionase and maltose regulon repressor activities
MMTKAKEAKAKAKTKNFNQSSLQTSRAILSNDYSGESNTSRINHQVKGHYIAGCAKGA